jgi:hypothetical protein
MKKIVFLSMLYVILFTSVFAADTEYNRATLAGLKGFAVWVHLDEDLENELSVDEINKIIELKLRSAGIIALSDFEWTYENIKKYADLHVKITAVGGFNSYAYHIIMGVTQFVNLERDSSKLLPATTWSTEVTGLVGINALNEINESVKALANIFLKAYLSANPK